MEQRHYHCHLCRREHPDRHDYFARYEQLELHFEEAHHPCMFERCRADKFVVFASEGELKRHTAHEHGAELSMTRSQRRAAMTVEAGFRSAPVPRVRRPHVCAWRTDSTAIRVSAPLQPLCLTTDARRAPR